MKNQNIRMKRRTEAKFKSSLLSIGLRFALILLVLSVTSAAVCAEGLAILVVVKGPDGKPVPGAQVQIERKDAKAPAQVATADAKGRIYFQKLALGTYRVSALQNRIPVSLATVTTRTDVPIGVSLAVKSAPKIVTTAKKKRYVYIPEETGTHIGGGRWIEVADDGTIPNDGSQSSFSPTDKRSGQVVNGQSSFQPHPGGMGGN